MGAFNSGEQVLIGLTSDSFLTRLGKKNVLNTYEIRYSNLRKYLEETFPRRTYDIKPLDGYFGPRAYDPDVEALIASPETGKRIKLVNKERSLKGVKPLKLVVIDTVQAEDGKPISSTRIRKGEIDAEGRIMRELTIGDE